MVVQTTDTMLVLAWSGDAVEGLDLLRRAPRVFRLGRTDHRAVTNMLPLSQDASLLAVVTEVGMSQIHRVQLLF